MKTRFLPGLLIVGSGLFPLQVSAMQECEIILKGHPRSQVKIAEFVDSAFMKFHRGDILSKDVIVDIDWTQKKPRSVRLHIEHEYYSAGSVKVNTGNELWATDLSDALVAYGIPGENRIMREGVLKASATPTEFPSSLIFNYRISFNGMKNPIRVLPAWCSAPEDKRLVRVFLDEYIVISGDLEFEIIRDNQKHVIKVAPPNLVNEDYFSISYDIVRKIGVDVPPVVDFGRVDAGVVTKKNIDVGLKYSGIPGRGYLTFNYADAKKMEVIINEKDDPQEHNLPYSKYLNGLRPNADNLSYQIGVKSDTVGDIEQRVRVTFNVF
ncbi:hypothetical protein KDH02_004783 [Salmonella enterica]|nr:hypothetical protein [Salmonella enterica]